MLSNHHTFHFVGVGGSGMSAIAKVLLEKGYRVTGSDISDSAITRKLAAAGAVIFQGHHAANIARCDAVVVSTAIAKDNPEVAAAAARGVPVYHRSDIVAALLNRSYGIAVAGAHGKTTTTSMLGVMLTQAGVDPTVLIGGEVDYFGGNARLGKSRYLIAEADESDGSFLKLRPQIAVVTNIENDHMDYYGTMENILHTFHRFLHHLPEKDGVAVLCFDNAHNRELAKKLDRDYISYALDYPAEYTARNIEMAGAQTSFDAYCGAARLGRVTLGVPGRHNVGNALAALASGLRLGVEFSRLAEGLALFRGAKRRFQTKANVNGVWVVDDYAHHPTEISATLGAARQTKPERLICVFQPHRYSRTKLLRREFGGCFREADFLILTDIYAAGEAPLPGIDGTLLAREVAAQTGQKAVYIADKEELPAYLAGIAREGDLVMTMGAGDIYRTGERLAELLAK